MNFAEQLRQARLAAGLTQVGLAEKAQVTQAAISYFETGQREPNLESLCRLILALKATFHFGKVRLSHD